MKVEGSAAAAAELGRASASAATCRRLRSMRWIAVAAGRARGAPAAASDRPLLRPRRAAGRGAIRAATSPARSAGRRPGATSTATVHTFCATVLDRVYLLQERFDEFRFEASGIEAILEPFGRGEGVLACGAHLGSFEALRMVGHDKGLRVAMIMYEDNARLINDTLAAIAPNARAAHDRARPRRRDAGAAPLARRRRPRRHARRPHPARQQSAALEDGGPALPRRAGALLRRPVPPRGAAAPQGRVHGRPLPRRHRYDLRFVELADFTDRPALRRGERDAADRRRRSSATSRRSRRCAAKRPTTGSTSSTSGPRPMPTCATPRA